MISRKRIRDFIAKYPDSASGLNAWYKVARSAQWHHLADVKQVCPSADPVGRRTVFNVGGNNYRLIARVNYENRKVFVLFILTHKEYDKGVWKKDDNVGIQKKRKQNGRKKSTRKR